MKAGEKKTRQMGDRSFRCMVWMYKIADFVHLANPRKRLEKAGLKEGMVIVDYGCGPGRYAIPSAETVGARGRVFAVDVQPLAVQMVKQKAARKSLSNVEAILLDSYATPVEASIVDIVLLIDTLHLIDDCGELFREIRRLLRPDGAIFMDPGHMKAEKAKAIIEETGLFEIARFFGSDMLVVPKENTQSPPDGGDMQAEQGRLGGSRTKGEVDR